MAYKLAIENAYVRADVIEVAEFPQVVVKYGVIGVPLTIVNEKLQIRGDMSASTFLQHIVAALKETPESPDEPPSSLGLSEATSLPKE